MTVTAAVLAEICSALPLSGSIYIWAAEAAGGHSRLIGYVVAWWACTAWMTFCASVCQNAANHLLSVLVVYGVDFPGGLTNDSVKFRAVTWAVAEIFFFICISLNYLPQRYYAWIFKGSMCLMLVDTLLNLIWLPIGVSRTYGFRSASEVFTSQYNGTGAPAGWNWMLCFLFGASAVTGFDASGHIAEETKNASVKAARGILTSAFASGGCAFFTSILFLFCLPDLDTWSTFTSPQPFVQVYDLALGRAGCIIMTTIAVIGLLLNCSIAIVAASRLVFAVARDGVLPFSSYVGKVTPDGRPAHAVNVMLVFGAALLCTILPSTVAFTSLVSAGGIPTIAAYALISFCRLVFTPNSFKTSKFGLGPFARPFYIITFLWNCFIFAVNISPFYFPVESAAGFNYSIVIFVAVTFFGVLCWRFTKPETWLRRDLLSTMHEETDRVR
ncbi:hypothetical protein CI109_105813 [Kwoniella shandongensis]|uniref:Uncharacterized protein n=1 Tax=Kwoniella shandongensis TaxID=1734106 RepID=A0A5M6C1Y5_9TREE|nr:uncharacterized protein CI109_003152 [Kwoniella shandongensis]KAA5528620.1 hypothetical protein CI109_003152 [Kwoniella shandongensis]